VGPLFRRPEGGEGDGGGKAPGGKSKDDRHREGIAHIRSRKSIRANAAMPVVNA
jgi:hypothetical protein